MRVCALVSYIPCPYKTHYIHYNHYGLPELIEIFILIL